MTDAQLKSKLEQLHYSCYLVVHGAARDHRTMYRREHHGVFGSGMVNNAQEAFDLIEGLRYPGLYSEMDIVAVYVNGGELCVEEF